MRSLESSSRSRNLDMTKDPEGIYGHTNKTEDEKPKSFEEHMRELKALISDLSGIDDTEGTIDDKKALKTQEELISDAREKVLASFEVTDGDRIKNAKNRVFETTFGPSYDDNPNVFRTNENSVYRITGIDQVVDIVNSGHVRPKEGKLKGGHENEVFWSKGGQKLNFIDERPIIEASTDSVKDGQNGALSLDDLLAVWIFNPDTKKRENKLDILKESRKLLAKDEQISKDKLNDRLKNGISLSDISMSF